jgi:hypothetical protein
MDKDRPQSPFAYSTASSASFYFLGHDLISPLDEDFQCNPTWKDSPFIPQKVVGVRVEITSTSYRNQAITYKAVIAGYIDRPGPGLELAKLEKDGKLFTSSGLYVLYCHITELKLLDNINANCIEVLGTLYPLKYVTMHKAAYNHTYMMETFGHNEPNPILQYTNNPVPLTEDGKIDMPYLKALIDLQPQKYGISTWLHKTGVYKYATEQTFLRACQKCYAREILPSKWDLMPNKSFMIWGFPLFANILYPSHTGTTSTSTKKPNSLNLQK